jgi:hypothetical protein
MNKLIYELTMKDWFLSAIEYNYSDTENCYNFNHQKLKGFILDILVDKETNLPTKWELWVSRFNHRGIYNNLDEIYTLDDYIQLQNQLNFLIETFKTTLEEVKEILSSFGIPMREGRLTYDGGTGLDLKDILKIIKE